MDVSLSDLAADTAERATIFGAFRPIVHGLARTFGESCEVVLHDFADPEHSIIEISGSVTNRAVGGSVTQIGLALLAKGDAVQDQIGYVARSSAGRVIKASTLLLRDSHGHVIGALCLNFDVTDLRAAAKRLAELSGPLSITPAEIEFNDDISRVLQAILDDVERESGRVLDRSSKADRLIIVAALRRRGAFAVQRAVPFVAEFLGVSRATVYAYLEEIRTSGNLADGGFGVQR